MVQFDDYKKAARNRFRRAISIGQIWLLDASEQSDINYQYNHRM